MDIYVNRIIVKYRIIHHSIRFIPSLLGVFLFLVPIYYKGTISVPIAFLVDTMESMLSDLLPTIIYIFIIVSTACPVIARMTIPCGKTDSRFLNCLLHPALFGWLLRGLAMMLIGMIHFQVGPHILWNDGICKMLINDILPGIFLSLIVAGLLMPLLIGFGLPERLGALFGRFMRPVFLLPKHAAVTCIASWVGDGSVGIAMTSNLYEIGVYNRREAAVIGTTFSTASMAFCMVIIRQVGLLHMFVPFYLTVCIAGLVAAILVPRIPPLSGIKNSYAERSHWSRRWESGTAVFDICDYDGTASLEKKHGIKGLYKILSASVTSVLVMIITVLPAIVVIGMAGLLLAKWTHLFQVCGMLLTPFLALFQIPEAAEASACIASGFIDMFLPSLLSTTIESDLTRFFIAAMSVTQILYVSETGALLMASKIPIHFMELLAIYLLRTWITLPVIALMGHIFL